MGKRDDPLGITDYRELWSEFFSEPAGADYENINVLCPFHGDEKTKSLSINLDKGLYRCHASTCGVEGNFISFYAAMHGCDKKTAKELLLDSLGTEKTTLDPIPERVVEDAHRQLLKDGDALLFLKKKRGISNEVINRYKIGWNRKEKRYWIPVRDAHKKLVNIRKYSPDSEPKMLSWGKGYGEARLFPADQIRAKQIVVTEGELDALALISQGLSAITGTGGAGTWKNSWSVAMKEKAICCLYDIDEPGQEGAEKTAKSISRYCHTVSIAELPIDSPPNADVTDFIVDHHATKKELLEVINSAKIFTRKIEKGRDEDEKVFTVKLFEAAQSKYYNKRIRFKGVLAGKDLAPYIIPSVVEFFCELSFSEKSCAMCPVGVAGGNRKFQIENSDSDVLDCVNISKNQLDKAIKMACGVPFKCYSSEWKANEAINVEEIRIIPEIDFTDERNIYVNRQGFYISENGESVETNRAYEMEGRTIPNPRSQYATHVIRKAEHTEDSLDRFFVSDELVDRLKIFQLNPGQDVAGKFKEIHDELEDIAGIYKRQDFYTICDLTFHSVLSFMFGGRLVHRGWVQSLAIGDTRCGKTATVDALIKHYRAGELISGESVSFAGLVGGLHSLGNRWNLQWGKIPLADRRLVAIDEISGMHYDDIGQMSSMRSSGIAEVTKIQTERTNARTRMIWLSNVRSAGRRLAEFSQGVLAVRQLIGRLEDISRFDLVLTLASEEVPIDEINQPSVPSTGTRIFTSDVCNSLLMWAWSRKTKDVIFSEGTEELILHFASEQGRKYSPTIPVVEPAEQREKIARVAAAVAARVFSTDDTGEKVIVLSEHVDFAYHVLEGCYTKRSMAYDEYSRLEQNKKTLKNEQTIAFYFDDDIADALLDVDRLTQTDLLNFFDDYETKTARGIISNLIKCRALRRSHKGYYMKTEAFIKFLRSRKYNDYKM